MTTLYTEMKSPLGTLLLTAEDGSLTGVHFPGQKHDRPRQPHCMARHAVPRSFVRYEGTPAMRSRGRRPNQSRMPRRQFPRMPAARRPHCVLALAP